MVEVTPKLFGPPVCTWYASEPPGAVVAHDATTMAIARRTAITPAGMTDRQGVFLHRNGRPIRELRARSPV